MNLIDLLCISYVVFIDRHGHCGFLSRYSPTISHIGGVVVYNEGCAEVLGKVEILVGIELDFAIHGIDI